MRFFHHQTVRASKGSIARFQPRLLELESRLTPAALVEPVGLYPRNGVLEVTLTARQSTIDLDTVATPVSDALAFSYQVNQGISDGPDMGGGLRPGPTLHVNPGQTLIVHFANELSGLTIPDFTNINGQTLTAADINLHTHGLHISPDGNSDNVLLNIAPGTSNTYTRQIAADQPEGLYWYHTHLHGVAQPEIYFGLAGMLVIGKADGNIPKVSQNQLPTRTLAIQYNDVFGRDVGLSTLNFPTVQPWNLTEAPIGAHYVNVPGSSGYTANNLFSFSGSFSNGDPATIDANPALPESGRNTQFTINGQFQPTLQAARGQTEVWSLANISDVAYARLRLTNTADGTHPAIVVLGQDGITYTRATLAPLEDGTVLLMPPATRFVIAVTMPESGDLILEMPPDPSFGAPVAFGGSSASFVVPGPGGIGKQVVTAQGTATLDPSAISYSNGFNYFPTQELFRVSTTSESVTSVIFAPGEPLNAVNGFEDLSLVTPDNTREIVLIQGPLDPADPAAFVFAINGITFPYAPVLQPRLNSVEEWVYTNITGDQHPLHVHVNSFQVMEVRDPNNSANSHGVQLWDQDTVNVPAARFDAAGILVEPGVVKIRAHFRDYTGTFVQHCHRLDHEDLGMMQVVTILTEHQYFAVGVAGTDGADAHVEVRDATDSHFLEILTPFPGYQGPLSVALGDVDGNSISDMAVSSLAGSPHVILYSGASRDGQRPFSKVIASFLAEGIQGGVSVALGTIDGKPGTNLVLGSQGGMEAMVSVVGLQAMAPGGAMEPITLGQFVPFAGFNGSIAVATGLVDDSGRVSIVVGAGPGAEPRVGVFSYLLYAPLAAPEPGMVMGVAGTLGPVVCTASFYAFSQNYLGGISVGTGWVNGPQGGFQNILVGALQGTSHVVSFSSGSALNGFPPMVMEMTMPVPYYLTSSFYAFGAQNQSGVRVSASDTLRGARLLATSLQGQTAVVSSFDLLRIGSATQLTPERVDTLFLDVMANSVPAVGGY